MRIEFSKEDIISRIKIENSWWEHNALDEHYLKMKKREYFNLLYPLITENSVKRAVILMGPRRVGKTVLLFHTIQELINSAVPSQNICYFSVETPIYNGIPLEELMKFYFQAVDSISSDNIYIFFDEIQYLKNWEIHLKSLVDFYHNIKFIVSGSAAAALKLKSDESGAGRFTEFILPPLTFHEYISLKNIESLIIEKTKIEKVPKLEYETFQYEASDINALNKHFIDYINFGGYPEVSLSKAIQQDPGRYIKNDIIEKVLLMDLPSLYGIEDIQELNSLFTYIAYNSGNEMSLDTISKTSGVAKNTIKKYITYLEAAFLIKVVKRIDNNGKQFRRANFFKIYLTNPSLRCALFSPLKEDNPFMGNMVETAIYSQWQHSDITLYYARWESGEIDLVSLEIPSQKPQWAIEIKWSNKMVDDSRELKKIKTFCIQHKLKKAMITTYDIKKLVKSEELDYDYIPASLYCYMVGRNIVRYKRVDDFYQ